MRNILVVMCFVMSVGFLNSQPIIPVEYRLDSPEDYKVQEDLVKECLIWLLDQPINVDLNKRNELNAFIMIWLSGSPEMTLDIKSRAMPFLEVNEDLFFTFVQGMALYKLNHKKETDIMVLHSMGLKAVAEQIIKADDPIKKDKEIKKLLRAYKKGDMNSYVKKLMES